MAQWQQDTEQELQPDLHNLNALSRQLNVPIPTDTHMFVGSRREVLGGHTVPINRISHTLTHDGEQLTSDSKYVHRRDDFIVTVSAEQLEQKLSSQKR